MRKDIKCGLLVGGNRSGKTESGAMIATAVALGRDDAAVQKWMKANDIPESAIYKRPGRVCCVSLTSNESIRVQRPKIAKLLPAGTYWKNRHGGGEAIAQLPNGGAILFKTIDQGARSFQADAWDCCWFDEDPEDEAVFNEARMRLVDRRGWCLITMTPLRGLTWIWDRFVHDPEPGSACHWIHGQDNPYIPSDELQTLLRSYGVHERAARERGEFTTLEGRVYQDWSRQVHVVDDIPMEAHWLRYASIDFGTRNPFCCLMAVVDPKDDTLYIIDEHYQREWTLKRHAGAMKQMFKEYGQPDQVIADPEDRGSRLSLASEHGIDTVKARKEIRAGINTVAERLSPDANGRPHLLVHSRCRHLIREIEAYIWDKRRSAGSEREAPKKANDHAMDALRYLCRYLQRSSFDVG
jgi:phage terminase large subunit-like protein